MGIRVQQAGQDDRELVVSVLEEAFHHDPVSSWVFPDEAHRRAVHGKFLGVFADITLAEGRIDVAEDGAAVALWLPVPAGAPEEEDPTPALMRQTADPDNERCELVGRLTGKVHPHDRAHSYLLMIGVSPQRQGRGRGRAHPGGAGPLRPRRRTRLPGGEQRPQPYALRTARLPLPGKRRRTARRPVDVAHVA